MQEKETKDSTKQTFMMGVMTLFIAEVVVKLLGLIYRLVITNIDGFGDTGNSFYSAGYQIYTLLLAVSSIGVPNAISKLVSERLAVGKNREAHEIFKTAILLFAFIGLVASILLFVFSGPIAKSMGNPKVQGVMMALAPAIFFVAIASVIRGYFNGMYNMKATSNSQMLEQLLKSILTILFVQVVAEISIVNSSWLSNLLHINSENRTVAMAIAGNVASTVSTVFGCLYLYIFYLRHRKKIIEDIEESKVEYKKEKRSKIIKKILSISIPISIASIISAINRTIDTFTIVNCLTKALSTRLSDITAIEAEANRLNGILLGKVDTLINLPASLNVAFATALVAAIASSIANGDIKTAKNRLSFSIRTSLLIALPCAVGMFVLSEPILNLLFPNAISPESTLLLQISSFIIIFMLMNQTLGGALQGLGKVYVPAISLAIGAVVKLFLNLILIPHMEWGIFGGINGAAIGSAIASLVTMLINFTITLKSIKLNLDIKQTIIKPVLITIIMGISAYYSYYFLSNIISPKISTIVSMIIAVIVYLIAFVIFNVFDKEDYHMLPKGDKIYIFLAKLKLIKA